MSFVADFKYLKRFLVEPSQKRVNFLNENPKSELILITDTPYPRFKIAFGGVDSHRDSIIIDVEEFIGVKGIKAKGKRIHTWNIQDIEEIEPLRFPEEKVEESELPEAEEKIDDDGQMSLF